MFLMKPLVAATVVISLATGLSACAPIDVAASVSVALTPTSCELSQTIIPAGVTTFAIQNSRDSRGEFYIFKADGRSVAAEVENIGAGLSRNLTAELAAGQYIYACLQTDGEAGMRGKLVVTAGKGEVAVGAEVTSSINAYKAYVNQQTALLLQQTHKFADAVNARNVGLAKSLYASSRTHWERIEPVAESFGDLDPKMDARDGDLDPSTPWTGWHALEKQLWITGLDANSSKLADQLVADTKDLVTRIASVELTLSQISNGAKELMDEVATGKVTGEEERYSRTDLWDFDANVAGAMKVVEVAAAILETKDADLLLEINTAFAALNAELDKHRDGSGFKLYSALTSAEIKQLAALVEATSEPLSHMTAALVK
jgi:iron uptake system component EfeO